MTLWSVTFCTPRIGRQSLANQVSSLHDSIAHHE